MYPSQAVGAVLVVDNEISSSLAQRSVAKVRLSPPTMTADIALLTLPHQWGLCL
jgi:hypothetical protein